jgi:hypothetical protein
MRRTVALEPSAREGVRTEGASAEQPKAAAAVVAAAADEQTLHVAVAAEEGDVSLASISPAPVAEEEGTECAETLAPSLSISSKSTFLHRPISLSLRWPSQSRRMLSGLRSRWM